MTQFKSAFIGACALIGAVAATGSAHAVAYDIFQTSGSGASFTTPIATIEAIETAQTAAQHYSFSSASGHPSDVPLGPNAANIWLHLDTNTNSLGFGFIFGQDAPAGTPNNTASLNFRIVNSATNPVVVISDDPGEAVETPAGSNAFVGNYSYGNNSDGIMIDGISGSFTIIIDSVDFGSITSWTAAGGTASDVSLILGEEYRITPTGQLPSGVSVTVPEPTTLLILGGGLLGLGMARRRRRA